MRRYAFLITFIYSVSIAAAYPKEEAVCSLQHHARVYTPFCGFDSGLGERCYLTVSL